MGKETGVPTTSVTVDDSGGSGEAITDDITSWGITTPRNVQDVTGVGKSAFARLLGLVDGGVDYTMVFNDAASPSMFDVFKTVPSSTVQRTNVIVQSGQTMTMETIFADFPLTRAANGELTSSVTGQLSNGTAPAWS